jgi:hypothetical protein
MFYELPDRRSGNGNGLLLLVLQLPWLYAFQLPDGVPECGVICALC